MSDFIIQSSTQIHSTSVFCNWFEKWVHFVFVPQRSCSICDVQKMRCSYWMFVFYRRGCWAGDAEAGTTLREDADHALLRPAGRGRCGDWSRPRSSDFISLRPSSSISPSTGPTHFPPSTNDKRRQTTEPSCVRIHRPETSTASHSVVSNDVGDRSSIWHLISASLRHANTVQLRAVNRGVRYFAGERHSSAPGESSRWRRTKTLHPSCGQWRFIRPRSASSSISILLHLLLYLRHGRRPIRVQHQSALPLSPPEPVGDLARGPVSAQIPGRRHRHCRGELLFLQGPSSINHQLDPSAGWRTDHLQPRDTHHLNKEQHTTQIGSYVISCSAVSEFCHCENTTGPTVSQ